MIEKILKDIKVEIENMEEIAPSYLVSKGTHNGFEQLVPIVINKLIDEYDNGLDIKLNVHYGTHFPDLDIIIDEKKYGVEIKFRKNGTWNTLGNSVFESITDEDYENIYLLFGSQIPKTQQVRVKFAPYWQATSQIKVTHSPRFTIDMDDLSSSVFESEAEYNTLKSMNQESKLEYIQEYLKQNTQGSKWYISDKNEVQATLFKNLDLETKKKIIAEILILYPDDLIIGNRMIKYDRATQYMLDEYYTYSKSLRDSFSANGKVIINSVYFPRIIQTFKENHTLITSIFLEASDDFKKDALDGWIERNLISSSDINGNNISQVYKLVLNNIASQDGVLQELIAQAGYSDLSTLIFE